MICWRLGLWTCVVFNPSVFCICDEREWCTDYGTPNWVLVKFQFNHKTRQTMLLYAYFTPKVDFKRKFNHHQSFLYEWRLTARTTRKFRIRPSIRIESRIRRTIRNRIESQSFAGPYTKCTFERCIDCIDIARRSSARGQTTLRWEKQVFIHTRLSHAYLALAGLSCYICIPMLDPAAVN